MIDKCRRRMNGGERYITTEISQRKKGQAIPVPTSELHCSRAVRWRGEAKKKKETQKKERGSWGATGVGDSCPRARGSFSLERWAARFCVFFTPKTSRRLIRA